MANKKPGSTSIALKLNLRFLGLQLSTFILINFILALTLSGLLLYNTEKRANDVKESVLLSMEGEQTIRSADILYAGYVVSRQPITRGEEAEAAISKILGVAAEQISPFNANNTKRNISYIDGWRNVIYQISYEDHKYSWQLKYNIGSELVVLTKVFSVLFIIQFLLLLRAAIKNALAIRKTLKPISEMAATAQALNQVADGSLQNLAGVISNIDVNQLDQRIAVDQAHQELQGLAQAINMMLNRISAAYQSQVRFVSDASHELRTPISVIQGYVNMLDRWGKSDPQTLQEAIDAIKGEAESMKTLVEQLLFLARGDNETIQLQYSSFDVGQLAEEIVRDANIVAEQKASVNQEWQAHKLLVTADKNIEANADRQLLKQALRILLDNSIKYTPLGGSIKIEVRREHDEIRITVQDQGIGIPATDVPYVFERFYRSDESRARKTGGSGLGLAIAKWIVDSHQGYFEVVSFEDVGTKTTIVLPVVK